MAIEVKKFFAYMVSGRNFKVEELWAEDKNGEYRFDSNSLPYELMYVEKKDIDKAIGNANGCYLITEERNDYRASEILKAYINDCIEQENLTIQLLKERLCRLDAPAMIVKN